MSTYLFIYVLFVYISKIYTFSLYLITLAPSFMVLTSYIPGWLMAQASGLGCSDRTVNTNTELYNSRARTLNIETEVIM